MSMDVSRRKLLKGMGLLAAMAAAPTMMSASAVASASDSGPAVDAVRFALAGNYNSAIPMAAQSGDTVAIKLVEMLYLKDKPAEAGYARIANFLTTAPGWPLRETLRRRAEQALYETTEPTQIILNYFAGKPPTTAHGALAMARASYATGDNASATKWLKQGWLDPEMTTTLESSAASEFSKYFTTEMHKARLWQLIFAQHGGRAEEHAARFLSGDYRNAAKAARELIAYGGGAPHSYSQLSPAMRGEMAMLYVLARYYRWNENYDKVRNIFASVPANAEAMGNPDAWFEERRIIVRRSVGPFQSANYRAAYVIAKNHGLVSGDGNCECEFLAGWVALRYLNDASTALPHFRKLQSLALNGTDAARAFYWIGRAHAALGDKASGRAAFVAAAKHTSVYYGQLAREEIGRGNVPEEIAPAIVSASARNAIVNDELLRAMRLMTQAGAKNRINIFLMPLAERYNDLAQLNAVASEIAQIGGTAWAVRFAKATSQRSYDLDAWSYPILGLPNWKQVGKGVERPLVFALSRQESEFDPDAGSSVGAQGLMQLMPSTARLVAKQVGVAYSAGRLKEPAYNVQLGSAFLATMVDKFNGSYVLTLIAYNAGPRRSNEWVSYFGDPRSGRVDPIDFVECIPFNETRQYVQKVLQNLHIYRSRLEPSSVRPMSADLKRGQPDDVATASTIKPAGIYGAQAN
ncbi:MAG: lytic transglycosylase domain-containing protein [Aestuariivirga sp.]